MPKAGDILTVTIIDLAFGGKGLAKTEDGYIVFVDGSLPGQTVKIRLKQCKKSFAHAKIIDLLTPSPDETDTGFQAIPGAPWAKLPVEIQHQYKRKIVTDLFRKLIKTDLDPVFDEFIASPLTWGYRNKMEYSFGPGVKLNEKLKMKNEKMIEDLKQSSHLLSDKLALQESFALGSKQRGQFTLVENLDNPSGIFDIAFEETLSELRDFLEETGLPVYIQDLHQGFFRNLVVRKSFAENKYLINLVTSSQNAEQFDSESFKNFVQEKYSNTVQGLFWTISDHPADPSNDFTERQLLLGEDRLEETLQIKNTRTTDLSFSISLNSFFQPNPKAAERLYAKAIEYADLQPDERAYDLFCGTGTIAQILAAQNPSAQITGVEIVESAVVDAKQNAQKNNLPNCDFVCADVRAFLKKELENKKSQRSNPNSQLLPLTSPLAPLSSKPTTIILDPPRAGMHPKSLNRVLEVQPVKLIYVSCNPATMARDTQKILAEGYELEKISLVDQFPHTSHIECVGKFSLKK